MADGYYSSKETDNYRRQLEEAGHPAAEWDDFQLTSYLVQDAYKHAQDAGVEVDWDSYDEDFQRARRRVELKAPEYLAGRGFFGTAGEEFSRGLGSGIDSMQGGYQAVLGLAAGALGAEDTEENLLKKAQANFEQSSLRGSSMRGKFSLAFDHILDEGDFGPMGRWLASGSGEALASGADVIASLVAGGGAGAVAIQAGKKKAISEIKDEIKDEVKDKIGGAFSAQINKKIKGDAAKKAGQVAFGTGVATSGTQNTGHVYSDLYKYTQLDQDDPLYMSPAEARTKSTIAGAAMGSLDSIVPTFLASKLTNRIGREQATGLVASFVKSMPEGAIFTKDLAKGLGRNALRTAQTGAGESLTETAQEALQMFVEKSHTGESWTDQDMKHLVEAGALGFLGGAQMKMGTDVAGGISDLYKSREILRSKFKKNVEEAKKQKIEPTPEVQEDISKLDRTFTQSVGDTVRNINNDKLYKVTGVSGETLNLESVDGEERLEGQKSYLYPVVKDFFDTDEDTTEVVQDDVQEEKTFASLPPIPSDHIRIIHQTSENLIEKIKSEGLQWKSNLGTTAHAMSSMDQLDSYLDDQGNLVDFTGGGSTMNVAVMDIPLDVYDRAARPKKYANSDGTFEVEGTIDPKYFVAKVSGKNVRQKVEEPSITVDEVYDYKDGKILNPDGGEQLAEVDFEDGEGIHFKGLKRTVDNFSEDSKEKATDVARRALKEKADKERKPFKDGDGEWQFPSRDEPWKQLEFIDKVMRSDEGSPYYGDQQFADASALETELTKNKHTIDGNTISDDDLNYKARVRVATTYNSIVDDVTNETDKDNKKITEFVNQELGLVKNRDEKSAIKSYLNQREDFEVKNGRVKYIGGYDKTSTKKTTSKKKKTSEQKEQDKRKRLIEERKERFKPNTLWNYKGSPRRVKSVSENGDIVWGYLENQAEVFSEPESLADVKGARRYTAFRNPTVRIKNDTLVPVIKAPKSPKQKIKKPKQPPFLYTRLEDGRYIIKDNTLVHKDSVVPTVLTREPALRAEGDLTVAYGYIDDDGNIVEFGDDIGTNQTLDGKPTFIKGMPLKSGRFDIRGNSGIFAQHFNNIVSEMGGKKYEVTQQTRQTGGGQRRKKTLKKNEFVSYSDSVIEDSVAGVQFSITSFGGSNMSPKEYLESELIPLTDDDTLKQVKELGLLGEGNVSGYSKKAIVVVDHYGRVAVRSIFYKNKRKKDGKLLDEIKKLKEKNHFGFGNYNLVIHKSSVRNSGVFNPFSKPNPSDVSSSFSTTGQNEGSPFVDNGDGVQVRGDSTFRVVGLLESENFFTANSNFANMQSFMDAVREQNVKAVENGHPKYRFDNDPENEELADSEGYNPYAHLYFPPDQREAAKADIARFAERRIYEIKSFIQQKLAENKYAEFPELSAYLDYLTQGLEQGGQVRIRELSQFEQLWAARKRAKNGGKLNLGADYEEHMYNGKEGNNPFLKKLFGGKKTSQGIATKDKNPNSNLPYWWSEFKSYGYKTLRNILFEGGSVPDEIKDRLIKQYGNKLPELYKLDITEEGAIYNFFMENGGIPPLPTMEEMLIMAEKVRQAVELRNLLNVSEQEGAVHQDILDILYWYFFDSDNTERVSPADITEEQKIEIQEEINETVDGTEDESLGKSYSDVLKSLNDRIEGLKEDNKKIIQNTKQGDVISQEQIDIAKEIQDLEENKRLVEEKIQKTKEFSEGILNRLIDDPSFRESFEKNYDPNEPAKAVGGGINKDAVRSASAQLGLIDISQSTELDISKVKAELSTWEDTFHAGHGYEISTLRSEDILSVSNESLANTLLDMQEEVGHAPLAVGTILSEGDSQPSLFLEKWRSDLEDATGRNVYEHVSKAGTDKKIVDGEEQQEGILEAGVFDGSSDMGGGSGIVTASQRVGAEREPNPEVAAQESDRIRTQFLQGAEPGKVIKGYDALVRALKLVDDESTARVLEMLQPLRKQLNDVDVVWATDEQWAAVTEQIRIEKERAGQPVPTRYGQYSPLSRGGEEDPHIMMGNYYGYVKSDGTEMTEAERLQHMIRVLAEELQHAVLYTTIDALHNYRRNGFLPSHYKGKLSVKDFEYLSKSSGAIFDFLREKYAKEGKYSEILTSEQEMWASYAIDANFRAEIENLRLPKEFRARYRTTFQRVGDFFRRILSRIFTGIPEASILEMMDDHLKTFFKDSNKISGEDHKFFMSSLESQPILASQQFFDFWEGKSENKDPDPVEEDDWRRPTYREFYRIPKEALANRDFQTIARSYLARTTIDNDQSDMISGTALTLAGGLGLNKEGDVDRLANAIRAQLGITRPTLGSDKISDSQWNKYRKFKKSLLDTTTTTTEGVPVKDWENLAVGDKVTSEALRSLEGVDEEGRAILEDGEYFEGKVQQEKLDNLVKNLNRYKDSKAVIFPKDLKKELRDVLDLIILTQIPEGATGSEKIAYAKRKKGALDEKAIQLRILTDTKSEELHRTRTAGEMVNYILDNYINNEKSTGKGLDVPSTKERFLKSIENNSYYLLGEPDLEKESISLRDIAIALYKNVMAGKFQSESRSGELGYSVNYYVNELMKKMGPYYFPANKMERFDRSVGPELLDAETGKPLLMDINEATDLLVNAAEEFVWDVQLDTSDILGGQHSNIPEAFFEKLENLGLGKIGQLTILTEEQAKRLGTKEEVEALFEAMEDEKFSFSSNEEQRDNYGDVYKEAPQKKSSLQLSMEAREARKKIDEGAESLIEDRGIAGLESWKNFVSEENRSLLVLLFDISTEIQEEGVGDPLDYIEKNYDLTPNLLISELKKTGFRFEGRKASKPTADLSQEYKPEAGDLEIFGPDGGLVSSISPELDGKEMVEQLLTDLKPYLGNLLDIKVSGEDWMTSRSGYNTKGFYGYKYYGVGGGQLKKNPYVIRRISLNSEMYSHTPSRSEVEQNLQKEYAALAELMKVLTEATSTLPEELQNEITENLLKNRLSVTTSGKLNLVLKAAKQKLKKGQNIKRTADREQVLSKMLEKEEAEPIDSIGKFATTAERMRVARRTLELIEGSKREITKLMEKTDRIVRESEEELAKNKKRLEDLASGKRYDPDKVKKLVEKKLKSLINNTRYNNLAGMPDYNKGEFIDNLRANKVYEVLQAIIEGGMAPEQMSRQEIYDALEGQVSTADMFEGLTGERQDNVVRALLAEMLHKDTKNKARSAFSIEMRLSKNAPTRALKLEVEALRQAAISDDWKDVSTTGILGKQIDEIKQVRKQMTALNQKIAKQTQLMPLGKHLIEKYNERSMQIEDYLGSVITPEVAVGDMVDMLDLDKDGNIVPIKVKYMVSGKGYTEFVQKANRMKAILENPKYKISDAHRDAFARTYALIEQGLAKSYDATFTGTAFSWLESFSQVVSRAGDEEALMISTMINRLNTELRQYGSNAVRQGHSVSRAWYNLQAELRNGAGKKLSLEQIHQYLFNPFMAYVEGQPKIDDLNSLAEDFWSTVKKQRFKIHSDDAQAKKRWMELVQEIQVANNLIQKTAKEFNLPIEDSIKIMDPLLQKRTLYRGQIPMGALTLPRMLMMQNLRDASRALTMNDEKTNIFNQIVTSIREKTDKNDPLFEEDYDRNSFQAELSAWKLSGDVELFFLEPTLNDYSNPRNLGWMMGDKLVSMEEVAEAWSNSEGGDVGARIYQTIAELMPENVSRKDFVKYGLDFLTQINRRANAVVKKHEEYESKTQGGKENPNAIIYKAEVWNSLNSRDESVSLPSHFFTYSMMTEIDMRQMVAKMLMAHHFGRNQEKLDAAYKELLNKERELEAEWDIIYRKITDEPYPWADRDDNERNLNSRNFFNIQATKKFGLPRALRKKITSEEYEKLKSLYTRIYALKEAQKMKPAFAAYAKTQGSVLSDERAAVETLQTISSMLVANPKSAIMNLASIYQIFQLYDLQPAGFKAAFNVLKRMPVEALDTIMQGFGKNMFSAGKKQYGEEALAPLWTSLETATSDRFNDAGAKGVLGENTATSSMRKFTRMLRTALQSGLKIPGVNNRVINMILNGEPGREKLAEEGTLTTAPGSLSTFSLIPGFSNLFSWLSNATLKHTTLEVLADLKRRVEGAAHTLDQLGIDPEDNGYELSSENMEYSNNFLGVSLRDSKEVNDRIDRELANFGLSITKLAQDFRRRKKGDLSADPILDKNKLVAAHIASTQITFDGTSAKARVLDTKFGIYASPLLGWSTSMAAHANRKFRGDSRDAVDPSNIDTYRAFGVFALSALAVGVPISLFVMRGSELYDEEILGKDPGLGYVPPEAYLPFGLLFAINDPAFRTLSLVERLGRTSSFGGLYQEMATNALLGATGESFQRDITNRIMLISMASNLSDVFLNYLSAIDTRSADTFVPEYSSVIRPLMNIVGMNNVIQFAQYSNNLLGTEDFPLFSSEYKVTNVLNQRNKLRAITKAIGIETQKVGGGLSYRPNAMSIAIREMERSAYVGDRDSFLEAYRLALQLSDDADPKKDVADRFKRRNLRNGVSKYALGDSDWIKLLSVLDPEDRRDIEDALLKHSYYLQLIGGKPKGESRTKRVQIDDLRRQALL